MVCYHEDLLYFKIHREIVLIEDENYRLGLKKSSQYSISRHVQAFPSPGRIFGK